MEYEKRYIKDKHRAFILNQQNMIMRGHRDLQKMVIQVSEVLPHVPRDVIFRDLGQCYIYLHNINLMAKQLMRF